MKKLLCVFFAFAALLMLAVPTPAAIPTGELPAGYGLQDPDGPGPAAVTTHGEIRFPRAPLTRKQAGQAVKYSAEAPDSALFRDIVEQINNSPKQ